MSHVEEKPVLHGPAADIGRLCFLIARDLRTALDRRLAQFDLRAQQAAVLMQCIRQPGASSSQLGAAVGTDTAGITGLIDQLEKNGLVMRRTNPADRRAVIIELTKKGRALLPKLHPVFQAVHNQLLADYSTGEAAKLETLLNRLRQNIRGLLVEHVDLRAER